MTQRSQFVPLQVHLTAGTSNTLRESQESVNEGVAEEKNDRFENETHSAPDGDVTPGGLRGAVFI